MDQLLQGLRAAGERTRLRILGLCAHGELTASDLGEILGQSQPRVSRHLKLLVEAGLLERHQEGSWAYYRLASGPSAAGDLGRMLVDLMPEDDPVLGLDLERLEAVNQAWAAKAAAYFHRHAADWDRVRALHVDQERVDAALRRLFRRTSARDLIDIGTGTGHVLQLLGGEVEAAIGIDRSRDMLIVARANIHRAGLRHCQVRQADMMHLPFAASSVDAITFHMVLHYAEDPAGAIAEAARLLRSGGRLIIVDFAPHAHEELRRDHAHRWLGFTDERIEAWLTKAGLVAGEPEHLKGGTLTVALWHGVRPANAASEADSAVATG
ncbi:MAG TPA: metalloregulator ArsR/SmtB family transcription factor [Alphaproteobacteria bacterium]|nr:metalloregulator ArsR/SmtB family transcription factor [Alphaproteobacteria bacterium]